MRGERARGLVRVMRFHAEENLRPAAVDFGWEGGRSDNSELLDRPGDPKATSGVADRGHVLVFHVDERDVMAGTFEEGADGPAYRPGAPDQNAIMHHLAILDRSGFQSDATLDSDAPPDF